MADGGDLSAHMEGVARALLGDPNRALSSARELRFGSRGSLAVDIEKGVFSDHESGGTGGGVLKLIERVTGLKGRDAIIWLNEHGFTVEERQHHPANDRTAKQDKSKAKIVATYQYKDEADNLLFEVVRFDPKDFRQRRPDPSAVGGWSWSVKGVRQVPYRLAEWIEATAGGSPGFVVEGEKDVDRLWKHGLPATCNAGGAGKWPDGFEQFFRGIDVVIIPDNDEAGRKHCQVVGRSLLPVASRVRVLDLPAVGPKGDVSEWLENGGTPGKLWDLAESTALPFGIEPFQSKFGAVWFHEISGSKPRRDWLVKNLLLARTFGLVYGPPGCGKSFITSDLLLTCAAAAKRGASEVDWFGYRVRPFGVIYVVAEGRDDFEIRLHAWRIEKEIPPDQPIPFVFLPTSIDLRSSDADAMKLVEEIKGLSAEMEQRFGVRAEVVVIDTVARALAGGNENASEVMGAFVINCGRIQEASALAVLGVHHGGKEGGRGPRGHEALHGAADFEIEVAPAVEGNPNAWTVRKLKAGPAGATNRFRLKQRTVDVDAEGEPITSCVVVPESATDAAVSSKPKGYRAGPDQMAFLQALATAIEQKGVMPPLGLDVPRNVTLIVSENDAKRVFWSRHAGGEDGEVEEIKSALRHKWNRPRKDLLRFGIIGAAEPWLWLSGKPVQGLGLRGADPVSISERPVSENGNDVSDDACRVSEPALAAAEEMPW